MNTQPPLRRSRTYRKMVDIKLERYKPRDWDYQNPKHQIIPHFMLGRYKRMIPAYTQRLLANHKVYFSPDTDDRRELKPSIYRYYNLSQISTLPGAVLVNESKIHDDQFVQTKKEKVKKRSKSYINKILNDYGSNVEYLPGSKKERKEFYKNQIEKETNNEGKIITKNEEEDNNNEKVEKIKVNIRLKPKLKNRTNRFKEQE